MSVTYGFFNSLNHDRRYDAKQMSAIFDGIINDGVFMSIGNQFMVKENNGMVISVEPGRAWFNSTWTLNDAPYLLEVEEAEIIIDRIDAVVLEVNHSEDVRKNEIKIVKGTPSSSPVRPTLIDDEHVHQHILAYIYIDHEVSEITQDKITNMVGTTSTPFVTGILETMSIDNLVAQWEADWKNWSTKNKNEFLVWFHGLEDILDEETATHLLNMILQLQEKVEDLKKPSPIVIVDNIPTIIDGTTFYISDMNGDNQQEVVYDAVNRNIVFYVDRGTDKVWMGTEEQGIPFIKENLYLSEDIEYHIPFEDMGGTILFRLLNIDKTLITTYSRKLLQYTSDDNRITDVVSTHTNDLLEHSMWPINGKQIKRILSFYHDDSRPIDLYASYETKYYQILNGTMVDVLYPTVITLASTNDKYWYVDVNRNYMYNYDSLKQTDKYPGNPQTIPHNVTIYCDKGSIQIDNTIFSENQTYTYSETLQLKSFTVEGLSGYVYNYLPKSQSSGRYNKTIRIQPLSKDARFRIEVTFTRHTCLYDAAKAIYGLNITNLEIGNGVTDFSTNYRAPDSIKIYGNDIVNFTADAASNLAMYIRSDDTYYRPTVDFIGTNIPFFIGTLLLQKLILKTSINASPSVSFPKINPNNIDVKFSSTIEQIVLGKDLSESVGDTYGIPDNIFSGLTKLRTILGDINEDRIQVIGASAFKGCTNLIGIDNLLPTSIGANAFEGCTSWVYPVDMRNFASTIIPTRMFYNCSSMYSIPGIENLFKILTEIQQGGFYNVKCLTEAELKQILTIAANAFQGADKLVSAYLGAFTESIGDNAFSDCLSLKEVTIVPNQPPTAGATMFNNVPLDTLDIFVPESSVTTYRNATNWSPYSARIKFKE